MSKAITHNRRCSLPKFCFGVINGYFALVLSIQLVPGLALAEDVLDNLIDINIAANTPLEDALINWGTKVGVTVMINTKTVDRRLSPAVRGRLSARKALSLLLRGSGLAYLEDNKTIKVVQADGLTRSALRAEQTLSHAQLSTDVDGTLTPTTSSDRSESNVATDESADQKGEPRRNLETIVVTAQKRSEELINVPAAVTAISGDDLQSLRVASMDDMAYYVPGLTVTSAGIGQRAIVIRGLSAGDESVNASLVGTYLDDLPIGASSGQAAASLRGIDLNPFDLDHVEVLKGPQGTLYGANAMAGLIKYSLKKPNLTDLEATAGSSLESTDGSDEPNWAVHGALSFPIITNTLGFRISAYDKRDAGYIDNLYNGEKGINAARETGGLATLLWVPNERLTVNVKVVVQDVNEESVPIVAADYITQAPVFGGLYVDTPFLDPIRNSTRIYSLSLDWNLDFATLTSTSGWTRYTSSSAFDVGGFGVFCVPGTLGAGYPGCPDYPNSNALANYLTSNQYTKFVQEVRLASPENKRLQWLVGGFFTHEVPEFNAAIDSYTANAVPLPPSDQFAHIVTEGGYKEAAGFADLTFKLTDRFDFTAGGRYSAYSINECTPEEGGLLYFGATLPSCQSLPSTGVTTWMANARFHLDTDSMLYLRAGDGYRPGYGCPSCAPYPGTPGVINADSTTDYEMGFKGLFLDSRLQLDTSVYHILWRDIQTLCFLPPPSSLGYACNAGKATSNGWEFTGAYQVMAGLSVVGTLAYTHAYLTQNVTSASFTGGVAGDHLPYMVPWAGSLRVDYTRPLNGQYSLLLGMDYRYRDAFANNFTSVTPQNGRLSFATENLLDLYAGFMAKRTTLRIYATNVFNKLAFQSTDGGTTQAPLLVPIRPRTVGVSVDYRF